MNMLGVFTNNPLNTPVGQRIDKATDGSQETENWALNIEICDIINGTEEGAKEAVRAIRKKISNSVGKDWRAISYSLMVLETCVKNCGQRFHVQIANKDFLHELVKLISPKNEPPVVVQDKILSLIQNWADAFRGAPDLRAVEVTYQDLKSKGIEFPATDLDQLAPIHTPKGNPESVARTATMPLTPGNPQQPPRANMPITSYPAPVMMAGGTPAPPPAVVTQRRPTTEQMSKLRADIDIVQGNCRVFNEMLNVMTSSPTEATADSASLLKELNRTCRQMQQRIVLLIEQLAEEQVTEVLLRVNDDLNNAFLRYDRLERFRSMASAAATPPASQPTPSPTLASAAPPPSYSQTAGTDQSLIDFGSGEPTPPPRVSASALAAHVDSITLTPTTNLSSISDIPSSTTTTQRPETDEFDMFAQSRQYDASAQHTTAASYAFQAEAAESTGSIGSAAAGRSSPYTSLGPTATSYEFDQFLEQRVTAGESLPDRLPATDSSRPPTTAAAATTATTAQPPRNGARQMHKDDSDNALFAL